MEGIKNFFAGFWQRKVLRIVAILIVVFVALSLVTLFLADRKIYGTVVSQYDGGFEIMATETTEMQPNTEPWLAGKGNTVHAGDILFIDSGSYPFWQRGKIHLGDEVCLGTFGQRLPEFEGAIPLKRVLSVKVTTPFEKAAAAILPQEEKDRYVTGTAFADLIQKFNSKAPVPQGQRIAAGTPEITKDAPYYKLICTNTDREHPTMTLFTVETKNGETKAAAEQYEYAEVDYKADNHADMVFSHDNQTEALRIPLW